MGSSSNIHQCIPNSLESMEKSVSMPTLEPSPSLSPTLTSIPDSSNHHNSQLAERNLVSSTIIHDSTISTTGSSNHDLSQSSQRRSVSEEPTAAATRMEHKRQRLEVNGYDNNALDILLHPEAQPSTNRYDPIQHKFIRWCELHHFDAFNPDPAQIINYLAYGHHTLQWKVGTCQNYKSAILDLYDPSTRECIQADYTLQKFFTNLRALTVRSFDKPNFDLAPVLDKLHAWGPNHQLATEQLTQKLCFLLAVTGFLRHADLHRINLTKTSVALGCSLLKLLTDCPKEKRHDSPIERIVIINPHTDPLLCPVQVFQAYVTRVATTPCVHPHPTRPSRQINYLVRSLNDHSTHVSVQTISRHVKHLLSLIVVTDNSGNPCPLSRARAIGSTNAVLQGATLDGILVHGSWASSCVFDNFYRLSRRTVSNFTTMALSSNSPVSHTLTVPPFHPSSFISLFSYYFIFISEMAITYIDNCI
ncbi:hypothetical protein G6F43_012273 [Rhizopus delemar]|nr:hypothetical protein G6F43_012273 [Rhizopus delemar]